MKLGVWEPVDICSTVTFMSTAAFFDLDKTILAKSSAFAFARPFFKGGLISRREVLRSAYAQLVFVTSGADHELMEQMRTYVSNLVTGWDVESVQAIVAETLDEIIDPMVYQEAVDLIAEHRAAGHEIVIVSSSGSDMVEPIGARLGVDHTIATRAQIENGRYTGQLEFFAYGPNKALAIQELALERGYDLDECYAYSDSQTDLPMMEIVGHPVAVNPDDELREVAVDREWPIMDFAKPVALRNHTKQIAVTGTSVALGAAVIGVTWYVIRRMTRTRAAS
ncbi:MAG: HAD-IB family hydrolase [Candidatus Nanopelagicales bacterium]|nr:HAD-IB family hydrolase [Candidatus Nanopelagicales bacterium]